MALDSDMVTAAVAGLSLIIGYVIGRMTSGSGSKKQTNQIILATKIKKWKIDPKYSDILVKHGKNAEKFAESELEKLQTKMKENEIKVKEMKKEVDLRLSELQEIRVKVSEAPSTADESFILENYFSSWAVSCQRTRIKSEARNDLLLTYVYNEIFLEHVAGGITMPQLGEKMDLAQTQKEIENPFKKNFETMDAIAESMVHKNQGKLKEFIGASKKE